ncbi:MAG: TPM domain-containing protein [Phycisphaerae bacterium]|nr:TPM domain-containing protein [Phycisphaerae bacterium]
MKPTTTRWIWILLLAGSLTAASFAEEEKPSGSLEKITHPKKGTFMVDVPNIIDPLNEKDINDTLMLLQEEHGVTLYVVVVSSLARAGYKNASIEDVGMELLEAWKVGPATLDGKPWDRGILILFCRDDNQIRVETGKGWGQDLDKAALRVIQREMLPYFKQRKYSVGLARGIHSMSAAIRMQTPMRSVPPKVPLPKDDEYVVDMINKFSLETKLNLDKACRELYQDRGVPMFIVIAKSLADVSREGLNFNTVAERFYRFWVVGDEARRKAFQDRGVLLFFSKDDNLIGIELADAWGDKESRDRIRGEILNQRLVPELQAGQLPMGIMNSIKGIREAAQQENLPKTVAPSSPKAKATAPTTNPAGQGQ